jgi:sarcosine oxidase subunit beta
MSLRKAFPEKAEVVVIGGGVIGCSTAFHLAERGCGGVVLLEKDKIASGASCKAAGQVVHGGATDAHFQISKFSWEKLEKFSENGDIQLHRGSWFAPLRENDPEHFKQLFKAPRDVAKKLGPEGGTRFIGREEVLERYPGTNKDHFRPGGHDLGKLEGGLIGPEDDAWLDPYLLTTTYAKYAREMGVDIRTEVAVTGIVVDGGRVRAVETSAGRIVCRHVVLAAGAWSPSVAQTAGLELPVKPVRRVLMIIKPKRQPKYKIPMMSDECEAFSERQGLNIREDLDGCYAGSGSHEVVGHDDAIDPDNFDSHYSSDDVLDFGAKLEQMFPDFGDFDVVDGSAGFYATVPDANYIIGRVEEPKGIVVCTGFMGEGISASGGAGRIATELVLDGEITSCSNFGQWAYNPNRFAGVRK